MTDKSISSLMGSIEALLRSNPTPRQIRCRIKTLMRHAENCQHFYPMPVLIESLQLDIARLRSLLPPGNESHD